MERGFSLMQVSRPTYEIVFTEAEPVREDLWMDSYTVSSKLCYLLILMILSTYIDMSRLKAKNKTDIIMVERSLKSKTKHLVVFFAFIPCKCVHYNLTIQVKLS